MTDTAPGPLQAPRRNNYSDGILLDAAKLRLEQRYGIEKRWLLNRLALGSGVLCGLTVTAGSDGMLCIGPGVAIDGYGREIIVPTACGGIDAARPTDACGQPAGDKLTGGIVSICLGYAERDVDPTPADISARDEARPAGAASTTVETYCVVVREGLPVEKPAVLTAAQRDAIFPSAPDPEFDRRATIVETLAMVDSSPSERCIVLATVTLSADGLPLAVDQYTYRAEVFSNSMLLELIAALADRVDACCAVGREVT